jgi:hypothetical protein
MAQCEVARKKLERERRRAEFHRAELEESYQDHAISRETLQKRPGEVPHFRARLIFGSKELQLELGDGRDSFPVKARHEGRFEQPSTA